MAHLLVVPEVAAGATEVELSEWLVRPGATVVAGTPVAVVETEKAIVEIEAETDGVVLDLLASPQTVVQVGSPMALLGTDAELDADRDALLASLGVAAGIDRVAGVDEPTSSDDRGDVPAAEQESPAPGVDPQPQTQRMVSEQPSDEPPASAHAGQPGRPAAQPGTGSSTQAGGRAFVSPIARRMLRDAGIEPGALTGTGPHGRIVRADVEAAIAAAPTAPPPPAESSSSPRSPARQGADSAPSDPGPTTSTADGATEFTEDPHSRLRRAVATRLTESKQQVPHFYLRRTARVDELMALRARVNEHSATRVSVNDFIIRAVAVAHAAVPDANVVWTESAMRRFSSVDVSVAIASDRGLVTPVLRSVETATVSSISAQVRAYVDSANAGRLRQHDLEGGSITVTNLGMYGVEEFAAIINPPQSAILAVGSAAPVPVVVDAEHGPTVEVGRVVHLTLSVDHRAIDGALAAQWMQVLVEAIESPLRLLV